MTVGDDEDDGEGRGEALPLPPPRENPELLGHAAAEETLLACWRAGRMPHAWLITGPCGVGKATFAFRCARFLLAQKDAGADLLGDGPSSLAMAPEQRVFRLVASGGHPDLLVVERGYDQRRKRMRTEIVVEDVRKISALLRLTAADGGWRVVIVDDADDMNPSSANAVLKILEEPPPRAVLMLLSENPGRLLPTIRSRCRILALKPLALAEVAAALERYRPDLGAAERAELAGLAEGSIGRALSLAAGGGLDLYRQLSRLLARLPELDAEGLNALADSVARAGAEEAWALVGELLPHWIARMVALAGGSEARAVVSGEDAAMRALAARRSLDQWVEVWENVNHLFREADSVNLDRKQVVLNAFFALEAAARTPAGERP
ncbi:MAG TPA: DNA polymerase III subunit delta' [Stellaceae bacterium]|nr:DNA polymerase III subunit delta' [Stellaceae bacterium]